MAAGLPSSGSPARRRWLQYSLRTLLILVTVVGVWLAVLTNRARKMKWAIASVESAGGHIAYDYQYDRSGRTQSNAEPPGPEWLRSLVGDEYYTDVAWVSFQGRDSVRDEDLRPLRVLTGLRRVDLDYTPISDLSFLRNKPELHWLDLEVTQIDDDELRHLAGLTRLEILVLDGTSISDAGLSHFSRLQNLGSLRLKRTRVTGSGFVHLRGVPLGGIDLDGAAVSDDGLLVLGEAMTRLRHLVLRRTQITDAGVSHIANIRTLEDLSLSSTRVTNSGLQHLKELTNLRLLELQNTDVTDEGLEHLHGLTKLTELDVRGTRVTDAGVKAFQNALPNCAVAAGKPYKPR